MIGSKKFESLIEGRGMKAAEQKAHIINCIEIDVDTLETMIQVFKDKNNDDAEWNSLFISVFTFLAEKILKLILLEKSPLLLSSKIEPNDLIESLQYPSAGYKFKPENWIGMLEAIDRVHRFHDIQRHRQLLTRMATIRNGHVHCFHMSEKSKVSRYLFNEQVVECIHELSELASEACEEYSKRNFDDRLASIEVYSEYSWEAADMDKKMELAKKQFAGRGIYKTLEAVYGFKSLGKFSYELGECPNCKETVNVIIDIESGSVNDDGDEMIACQISAICCTECGFAADSSEICKTFKEDFDQTEYQEECLSLEYKRNVHGEIELVSLTPVDSYSVARMKRSGSYTSWDWDF